MYYAVILLQKFHLFKVHCSIVLYCLARSLQDSTEQHRLIFICRPFRMHDSLEEKAVLLLMACKLFLEV